MSSILLIVLIVIFAIILLFKFANTFLKPEMRRDEIIEILDDFTNDKGGRWDWDNFISIRLRNVEAEEVRIEVLKIEEEFPPSQKGQWCSQEGVEKLKNLAARLSREYW